MGKAVFVSHQWVSSRHPDPAMQQMRVLQAALSHLLHDEGFICVDPVTEAAVPSAKSLPLMQFQSQPLLIWYDYFSCPQLEQLAGQDHHDSSSLGKAISSIPAYIAKCAFFFALCPFIEDKALSAATWAQRGRVVQYTAHVRN